MSNEILNRIVDIINNMKDENVDIENVKDDSTFTQEFGLDSMELLTLIVEAENIFDVMINDIDLDFNKINNIIFFVSQIENELKKEENGGGD